MDERRQIFSAKHIREKIDRIQGEIKGDLLYIQDEKFPVFLGIMRGAGPFFFDLMKHFPFLDYDLITVRSYDGIKNSREVTFQSSPNTSLIKGRNIIVVEDIVDTGKTVDAIWSMLRSKGAGTIKICSLLVRQGQMNNVNYAGFQVDDSFFVGYGMDMNGRHRGLPFIGVENEK